MERVRPIRSPRGTASPCRRPLTAEVLGTKTAKDLQRLMRTPRVFHRQSDLRHMKRNELRANLLPCILQTPDATEGETEDVEKFKKRSDYKQILGIKNESEAQDFEKTTIVGFPEEWDPAHQAVNACNSLRDLVSEKASRFCRPIDGMVNTSSGLPFVHKDQAVDLEELMNVFTIEIQKQPEQIHKVTRGSATSRLQLASRVPLLVKDPATDLTMQTQPLPNDVHTLRLDMNPKEVRHITCDMKSRHFKGSELEGRLMSVVHPERGVLAKMLSALQQKEREAQGLTAVLNHLLREVSKPLRPQNISSAERLDALLSEPRRTLAQLLSVSDRLAEVVQPLVASVAHAIDRMALICVREVDRLASYCDTEFDKLLKALNTSEEARIEAEDRIDKMGGRTVGNDFQSRLKNMENELQQHARTHAKLIEEKNDLEAILQDDARVAAALRVKVKELEQEVKYLRRNTTWRARKSDTASSVPQTPSRAASVKPDADVLALDIDETEGGQSSSSSAFQISAPPVFVVTASTQSETEFYFCKGEDFRPPAELSFYQYTDVLETINRLFVMLARYEWNEKTASFLRRNEDDITSEEEEDVPGPVGNEAISKSGMREREIRRLKGKVEAAQQQAASAQLKEQVALLQLLAKSSFDAWFAKVLKDLGSSQVGSEPELPSPEKLFTAVMEVTQTEGLQRRIRELEDKMKRLIPMADRLRKNEGGDNGFWKRVMRSVRHSMTARRGSFAMKADALQRAYSERGDGFQTGQLDRLQGELSLIWQALPPKPAKLAAGTLLLRPMAPQVLQEAVRNYFLKSCGRHRQVEQAVCNLCRLIMQFANSSKVLLFAIMCDIVTVAELEGRMPQVMNNIEPYVDSLKVDYLANLPFDAVHTMSEFISAIKNAKQFAGAHDGSLQRIPQHHGDADHHRGLDIEREDMLLPCPLILAASSIICSRSKVTAHNFNLVLLSFARRPILKPKGEDQDKERERRNSRFSDKADIEVDVRSISRKSEESFDSMTSGGEAEANVCVEALFVSHLLAADRFRRHPDMWEETDSFVDSLWEAIVKTAREKKRQSIFIELDQTADAVMAAQVTKERFRLQVPESLVEKALLAMQPQDDTEDTHQGKVQLTKEAVRNLMYLWQQHGGAASMCFMESHALWAALWAMGLERAYEVHLMGKFFGIFDESGDDCLQYDEFVNFMAHIAPAVPEADCASLFMAVADDTSADMTQEVFLNLVQRVGVSSDLDGLENLVKTHQEAVRLDLLWLPTQCHIR
ncbi:unnamed protein product [Durusdinium trenchii]|uniref:EF-hand domain-containing protein n=1 Tax=Durusdinium trenchii TaxID=1381693 RepID=A0ABP0SCI5_9DINO